MSVTAAILSMNPEPMVLSKRDPIVIRLVIPEPTPLGNVWQRMHWAARRRLAARISWLVFMSSGCNHMRTPLQRVRIEIDRYCSGAKPDRDGLYGGVKPLLDCLLVRSKRHPHGLGYIVDDNDDVIVDLIVRAHKSRRSEHKTVIVITEAVD
jgi:hypothetical protein